MLGRQRLRTAGNMQVIRRACQVPPVLFIDRGDYALMRDGLSKDPCVDVSSLSSLLTLSNERPEGSGLSNSGFLNCVALAL